LIEEIAALNISTAQLMVILCDRNNNFDHKTLTGILQLYMVILYLYIYILLWFGLEIYLLILGHRSNKYFLFDLTI